MGTQRRPWVHPHYIDPLVDPWLRVKTLLTTAIGSVVIDINCNNPVGVFRRRMLKPSGTGNNTTASSWPLKIALHPWRSIPVIPQPFLWLCQHLPPLSDAPRSVLAAFYSLCLLSFCFSFDQNHHNIAYFGFALSPITNSDPDAARAQSLDKPSIGQRQPRPA